MSKDYCVYEHVFPNGKKYIGITCDTEKRWRNGKGYETQPKMDRAIKKYGWENVEHNIIVEGVSKEEAEQLEQKYIAEYNTFANGYNSTIGGNTVGGYYLDEYVLAMINNVKRYHFGDSLKELGLLEHFERAKKEKEIADFYNEASRAVTLKHGKFSPTSLMGVQKWFFHIFQYTLLNAKIRKGEDVSNWKEESYEEAMYKTLNRFMREV